MTLPTRPVLIRYALAALTAWLLPSYAVMAAMLTEERLRRGWSTDDAGLGFEPILLLNGPLLGLLIGWPCLLLGWAAWAILHRMGRARVVNAVLIGAAAPLIPIGYFVLPSLRRGHEFGSVISVPLAVLIVAIGAITGWSVWRVAYPRSAP